MAQNSVAYTSGIGNAYRRRQRTAIQDGALRGVPAEGGSGRLALTGEAFTFQIWRKSVARGETSPHIKKIMITITERHTQYKNRGSGFLLYAGGKGALQITGGGKARGRGGMTAGRQGNTGETDSGGKGKRRTRKNRNKKEVRKAPMGRTKGGGAKPGGALRRRWLGREGCAARESTTGRVSRTMSVRVARGLRARRGGGRGA